MAHPHRWALAFLGSGLRSVLQRARRLDRASVSLRYRSASLQAGSLRRPFNPVRPPQCLKLHLQRDGLLQRVVVVLVFQPQIVFELGNPLGEVRDFLIASLQC
jgi:hypothetical protein